MEPLKTIPDILNRFKERPKNEKQFGYYKNGEWSYVSSEQFVDLVECLALGLRELGLNKGDRVGLIAKSSPYWTIVDLAVALAGGVLVPYFVNLSEEHFLYETELAGPRFLFVGDTEEWEKVAPHSSLVEGTIGIEGKAREKAKFDLFTLVKRGGELREKEPGLIKKLAGQVRENDLATIIFTSGSTGMPKGVELTHKNLVAIIHMNEFDWKADDLYLSILPLAHIFAKQLNYIIVAWGIQDYFLNDLLKVGEVCKQIHPTLMITVPRLLEKVYAKMVQGVHDAGFLKRAFGKWAFGVIDGEGGIYRSLMQPIADKIVFSKFREALGGRMRIILSGGAALDPHIQQFFLDVGIPVIQGWGMTECSTIAVNRVATNKVGTVGPALPGIQFKIGRNGELLVNGPTVMRGYYKNPEATANAIDAEGWFHTGDQARIDEDGHVIIEGRINESFKTAQGEWVMPVPIELALAQAPLIETAMVVGDGQPYASALIFPDHAVLQKLKKTHHREDLSDAEFLHSSFVIAEMESLLHEVNSKLDAWQQIHDYRFILTPPSIEAGELTPTMKLRRKVLLEKYKGLLSDIYVQEVA